MAPTLFNLYACVVVERWLERVKSVEGTGTHTLYKQDQQLFQRSIRNAQEMLLIKGEFSDDVVLWARMRQAVSAAIRAYVDVAKAFGLTVSVPKTKFMVVGSGVSKEEKLPLALDDGLIEWVSEFPTSGPW